MPPFYTPFLVLIPNGGGGIRTLDPCLAKAVLSQLSYAPNKTSRLDCVQQTGELSAAEQTPGHAKHHAEQNEHEQDNAHAGHLSIFCAHGTSKDYHGHDSGSTKENVIHVAPFLEKFHDDEHNDQYQHKETNQFEEPAYEREPVIHLAPFLEYAVHYPLHWL